MPLQADILTALNAISDINTEGNTPEKLREQYAEAIATAIKNALQTWISTGVPTPQDGGAGLKLSLTSAIKDL